MGGERQLKVFRKVGKVCVKEMSVSEPLMKHRQQSQQVTSEPRFVLYLGIMAEETCLLSAGCAVYRWHELDMGSLEEQEKQTWNAKGNAESRDTQGRKY